MYVFLPGQDKEDNHILKTNDRFLPTTIKTEIQHSIQSAFQAVTNVIKPESGMLQLNIHL
jgi:hypothetical protein